MVFMKKLLMVVPETSESAPCAMRMLALRTALEATGVSVDVVPPNVSIFAKLRMAYATRAVLVTMPPFRNLWMAALPGVRAVFDWRDGWSIGLRNGFGGTENPRRILALVAKTIELSAIVFASKIITCTPGLHAYHIRGLPDRLRKKIILAPNGHQIEINADCFQERSLSQLPALTLICAGKFGEYGIDQVRRTLTILRERYSRQNIVLRVVGSNRRGQDEINDLAKSLDIDIQWEGRKPYEKLLHDIRSADMAVSVLRDERYDFGTKIFDYVALGVPVLDAFTDRNLREYFSGCFDTDYDPRIARKKASDFRRVNISDVMATELQAL